MAQKVAKCGVKREPGYLYFLDKGGNVCKTKMSRSGKKGGGKTVVFKAGVKRQKGMLYFIDKQGDVSAVKMNRKGGKKKPKSKLAKPTEKYVVYSTKNAAKKTVNKAKKVLLAARVRGLTVSKPTKMKGKYGVVLKYEAKVGNFYTKAQKFVTLQNPAAAVRVVNEVPKKYC